MKHHLLSGAVLAAALCVAVPANAQPQDTKPACLQINQIQGYKPLTGNRALIVTDRARKRYKISFNAVCHDMEFNINLGFRARNNSRLACLDRGDTIVSRSTLGADRCHIDSVQYYTSEMERADIAAANAAKVR